MAILRGPARSCSSSVVTLILPRTYTVDASFTPQSRAARLQPGRHRRPVRRPAALGGRRRQPRLLRRAARIPPYPRRDDQDAVHVSNATRGRSAGPWWTSSRSRARPRASARDLALRRFRGMVQRRAGPAERRGDVRGGDLQSGAVRPDLPAAARPDQPVQPGHPPVPGRPPSAASPRPGWPRPRRSCSRSRTGSRRSSRSTATSAPHRCSGSARTGWSGKSVSGRR